MQQANANSARGGWTDSGQGQPATDFNTNRANTRLLTLQDHARTISAPVWSRFLRSETLLRRAIPVLIVLLLALVAVARTASLMAGADALDADARKRITLVAELVGTKLSANPSIDTVAASPTLAEVFLEDGLSTIPVTEGQSVFLISTQGRIVAQAPVDPKYQDILLSRLLGDAAELPDLSRGFSADNVLLDGSVPALAMMRTLKNFDGETLGAVMVVQDERVLFAGWRQSVKLNVTLFLAIGSVLMVILYAYFAQGSRARNADQLYMETNARFDMALVSGHCGLWDWDLSRGRIVWSRSMYQMLGMEATDRVMGFGELADLMHPDDQDLMMLANQAFSAETNQFDHRFRMMHSTGSWVWMRIRAELVHDRDSTPHLIGIAIDISEQEALKQKSRDADIRLRDAIENISEAFVLWDSKKRLVMCNSKYQQLYNLPASAVTSGTKHDDVMAKSRKPRARHKVANDRSSEHGAQTFEAQIEDGRWLQISERRTRDGGFVSIGTDITQIKRNQEKLVESERKLMTTIADQRKTQQQLERQAQQLVEFADNLSEEKKRSDAANKAKSEFLANISHELRTPLNAIIGFSDIMRSRMFGPMGSDKYSEYADDIHNSGGFLLGVINDVLDMSKIEAGRFQLDPETVHLHELLDETMRIISIQAEEAEISVSQKIPKSLEVEADRRAVKQILLNLLSNAVKFTPKGGKINVTAKALKNSVNIVIEDSGIGISEEALEKLGQPFEQVQGSFTKDHKGTGLGLAIARSLTMLHGGSLKISSQPKDGTTVTVRLPFECAKPESEEDQNIQAA